MGSHNKKERLIRSFLLFNPAIVGLANAIIHLEVDVKDIDHVSNMVPARWAVSRAEYENFVNFSKTK